MQILAQTTRLRDRSVFYGLLGAIVIALGSTTGPLIGKYGLKFFNIILLTYSQTGGAFTGNYYNKGFYVWRNCVQSHCFRTIILALVLLYQPPG